MRGSGRELLLGGVRALRRFSWSWSLAIVAFVVLNVAFWPSFKNSDMVESFKDMGSAMEAFGAQDLASPKGYLDGQVFALMLPLLLSAMAIGAVTSVTSGDEGLGRLELLHALPVARRSIWLSRLAAALISCCAASTIVFLTLVLSVRVFGFDGVGFTDLGGATLGSAALATFHGAVAYAVGASGWSRARAVASAVVVLVAGYVAALVLPLADSLRPVRQWSPWYWALGTAPAVDGVSVGRILGLLALGAVVVLAGTAVLERRDIRTP